MTGSSRGWRASRLIAAAWYALACASFGPAQDPNLAPQYETINLNVGFEPDPVVVRVQAGGNVNTVKGGFKHFVAVKPDVRLNYTAGKYILTIYADCDSDATLLVRLPDGTWVANDNGPNAGANPVLKFVTPQTGAYNIWVGTIEGNALPPARLFITELKK